MICTYSFALIIRRNYEHLCTNSVGLGVVTTLLPYGDTLRLHRKLIQNFVGSSFARKHVEDVEEIEARRLLYRILETPQDFRAHLRTSVTYSSNLFVPIDSRFFCSVPGTVLLRLLFGYNADPEHADPLVTLADDANRIFSEAGQPGRWLIDIIPARTAISRHALSVTQR